MSADIKQSGLTNLLKNELRKQVLAARDGLMPEERKKKSRDIETRFFALHEYRIASSVLFYASFRSEVETHAMIRRALAEGKRTMLPKVAGKQLALFEIRSFDADLSPGAWGIPEPRETAPVDLRDIDLIVVPGAVFDEQGNRLGYGAGFYDKLVAGCTGPTVALAFELQVVPHVPAETHDVPVKKIVTEKRIITAQRA